MERLSTKKEKNFEKGRKIGLETAEKLFRVKSAYNIMNVENKVRSQLMMVEKNINSNTKCDIE